MRGYRRHVIFISLKDKAIAYAALDLTRDAVAVSFRIFRGVNEEAILNCLEVAAVLYDFFHEQASSFFQVSGHISQRTVLFELYHIHDAV